MFTRPTKTRTCAASAAGLDTVSHAEARRRQRLKTLFRFLGLMCLFVWAAARTWWAFRKEHGVEADDPDKERDV